MQVTQFAGQGVWGQVLNDTLTNREQEEKNHILKERIIDSLTVGYGKN